MKKVGDSPSNRGFTIVELLIVIVIIGVLAALVVAAFNGITNRANNTQTESSMNAWRKALIQYATENGSYPIASNACFNETNLTNCWPTPVASSTLNNALRPYMGSRNPLPGPNLQLLTNSWGAPRVGGGLYYNPAATLDGVAHPYYIGYNLKGLAKCNTSGFLALGSPWTNFSSISPSTGRSASDGTGNITFCIVALPTPSSL